MKGLWVAAAVGLALGACRGAPAKVADNHYRSICQATQTLTDYELCAQKAKDICGGPFELREFRVSLVASKNTWRRRTEYDIFCKAPGSSAETAPPAAPSASLVKPR